MTELEFQPMPRRSGRRTDTWRVADRAGTYLGRIDWYEPRGAYVLRAASGSRWDAARLLAVASWLSTHTAERR